MNKIKVIDLLNMISKGEEVPKRIKYKDEIRDYNDKDKDYTCSNSKNYFLFFNILRKNIGEEFKKALNDEVEIIEENKLPEKINVKGSYNSNKGFEDFNDNEKILVDKINDLLDYLESKEKEQVKPLTKKDIEALGYVCGEIKKCFTNGWTKSLENKPLEEEKKLPEKLDLYKSDDTTLKGLVATVNVMFEDTANKINEILDYLESKEKGE